MEQDLLKLTEAGAVGISIALIILIAYLAKIVKGFLANHIDHNTDAMNKLKETINELYIFLRNKNGNK